MELQTRKIANIFDLKAKRGADLLSGEKGVTNKDLQWLAQAL